jgi:phosphatidylinositol 3-kinase
MQWLWFPIKYKDVPVNAQLAITVWDMYRPGQPTPTGGTTFSLFGKNGFALRLYALSV